MMPVSFVGWDCFVWMPTAPHTSCATKTLPSVGTGFGYMLDARGRSGGVLVPIANEARAARGGWRTRRNNTLSVGFSLPPAWSQASTMSLHPSGMFLSPSTFEGTPIVCITSRG
ncbi:unnamed protein product [Ectocarpus sp. 12 AP-2014]